MRQLCLHVTGFIFQIPNSCKLNTFVSLLCLFLVGPGSVDGIATGYVLEGPGIESR